MKHFRILRSLMGACLLLVCATALAVPAKRVTKTVTMTDGTQVVVTFQGDENLHFYKTADGRIVEPTADGTFAYVSADQMKARRAKAAQRRESMNKARRVKHKVGNAGNYIGSKKGLVILVNFQDKKLQSGTATTFPRMANEVGYNGNGHYGSVHDYFLDQSYGQFNLTFDVVGPVTVSQNMAYYGANGSDDSDMYPASMVIEAINLVDDSQINFADYDWDNDGYVDQVYVIYAGYGEASGASDDTIWPHEWDLNSAKSWGDGTGMIKKDGKWINTYACSNELDGKSGTKLDGIGTMCHEFSHCLGLPDFYDTEGSNFGMDSWSLMDYGCYNSDGCIPCGYTAYERMFAGWLTPTELDEPATITDMPDINDQTKGGAPKAYIIYNKANSNEFYTLQNIQQTGWNQGAYGHGLLVGHIDFNQTAWNNNKVNTSASHQRGTIIHADNEAGTSGTSLAGDPYPGSKNKTSLTNTTTPAATLYNNNSDGKKFLNGPLTEITESTSGLISFLFDGGEQAPSPELAWSKTYLSVDSDEGTTPSFPTLTNLHGVSVTYSSSNTAVATVSTSGVVTLTGTSGTTTISAIFAGNDDYQAETVTYTLVVYSSSAGDQPAGTLWEEDFKTNYESNKKTYQYDLTNTTLQTQSTSGTNNILAGGESPELLIKSNLTFSAVIPMNGHYGDMTLTFKSNRNNVTTTASGATLGDATITGSKPYVYTIPVSVNAGTEDVTLYFKAGSDNARFDDARLYQGDEPTPTLVSPELSWSVAASSARVGASDNLFPTLSNPHSVSVTYTSSNTAAATIATNGAITLVAEGTTTISAIFAGNSTYEAQTVTYQLTVLPAESGDDDEEEVVELWSEDFSSYSANAVPTSDTYSYACTGSGTKIYSETTAGGKSPELLINGKQDSSSSFSATIPMNGHSGELTLTFLSNKNITVIATGATLTQKTTTSPYTYTVNVPTNTTTVTFTFSNGSANARVDNFLLTAPSSFDPQPQSAGLAWSTASYTATIDGENTFPTLTNPHSVSVTYSSSNTAAATINASTGAITLVAPGVTTISAKFNGNDDYQAQTVTYSLTVEAAPVSIANTIDTPYTIAQAYELIDAGEDLDTWVYVKGTITDITELDVTGSFGNATYSIGDNSTTDELLIYRGYGLNGDKFNAGAELIQVDDEVIVYGQLLYYAKDDQYEMAKDNYIVRLTHPTKTLTINDGDTYTATTAETYDELTYTRTFGNTSWQALYLPFSLSYNDWKDELEIAEIYNIIQYDDDNDGAFDRTYLVILHKTSGQTIPNRPYLVRAKTAGTFTRTLTDVELQPAQSKSIDCSSTFYTYTFTGIYAPRYASVMIANGDYALGGGELHQAASDADLKAQRWYMHITPREGAPTLLPRAISIIEHGEETTGIEATSANGENPVCGYDLQGRKFAPLKGEQREGLYIVGGKKVIR